MSVISCRHCGEAVTPKPDGSCPRCRTFISKGDSDFLGLSKLSPDPHVRSPIVSGARSQRSQILYQITCTCGAQIDVTIAQAGTEIACQCGSLIKVPRLRELRRSRGRVRRPDTVLKSGVLSPPTSRWRGYIAYSLACFFAILGTISLGVSGQRDIHPLVGILLWGISGLLFSLSPARYMYGRRNLAPTIRRRLRWDWRRPILLLRSFGDDDIEFKYPWYVRILITSRVFGDKRSFEEFINNKLWWYGPLIAIGQPGDSLPPLGAAREYIADEEWQVRVKEFYRQCRFFVLVPGATEGVAWELQRLAENNLLQRTLLVFPPLSMSELADRWSLVIDALSGRLPSELPWPLPEGVMFATIDTAGVCSLEIGKRLDGGNYKRGLRRTMKKLIRREPPGRLVLCMNAMKKRLFPVYESSTNYH
jgi:hypothetical protein